MRTQHQRPIKRIEIRADDVPHLSDEEGIFRELERLDPVRLQGERSPDPIDDTLAQSLGLGQGAGAPVRGVGRPRFQRPG
jgi:hypothetical protein